jgi:hypothetical protein
MLRFQGAHLYSEFRSYMSDTHGVDWSEKLGAHRAELLPLLRRLRITKNPDGSTKDPHGSPGGGGA